MSETEEQARLLGMSGERELALRAEIERLSAALADQHVEITHWHDKFEAAEAVVAAARALATFVEKSTNVGPVTRGPHREAALVPYAPVYGDKELVSATLLPGLRPWGSPSSREEPMQLAGLWRDLRAALARIGGEP